MNLSNQVFNGILTREGDSSFLLGVDGEKYFESDNIWEGYLLHWKGKPVCGRILPQKDYENELPIVFLWPDNPDKGIPFVELYYNERLVKYWMSLIGHNAINVNATDGLYQEVIVITWDSSENADQYKVYRDGIWLALVTSSLEFIDEYIDFETEYNYCVEAINECGNSNHICDTGYASYGLGDINEDGSLDVLDVVLIVNFIMGYDTPTSSQEWASDINNDETINIQDIILLVNMILD